MKDAVCGANNMLIQEECLILHNGYKITKVVNNCGWLVKDIVLNIKLSETLN